LPRQQAQTGITLHQNGILVTAPATTSWQIELFNLNGVKLARINGKGSCLIAINKILHNRGFSIARLTNESGVTVEKMVR